MASLPPLMPTGSRPRKILRNRPLGRHRSLTEPTKEIAADGLREQAAACRRLAAAARTRAGGKALDGLADHFDNEARRIDPSSMRR